MKQANQIFQLFRNARLATLLFSLLVVSCGGSVILAGIGGTGISFGTVLGFGSIIVNGSELDSSTVTVTLDDNPPVNVSIDSNNRGGLKEGMVVKISGDFSGNSGTAATIVYKDNLEGEVCSKLSSGGITTLRVLGQRVILDATTIVDDGSPTPATIDSIIPGDIVEVSGLPDNLGNIHASFVENKTASGAATVTEVKGPISLLTPTTFNINNLQVNYMPQVIDNSIPNQLLVDGLFVEVKSTTVSCNFPDSLTDTLTATVVELESEGAGAISDDDHAEVEGLITVALNPPGVLGVFKIGNQEVVITTSTRYTPLDFNINNIELGTKVEAEGTSTGGVFTADKISFRESVRLESKVATVSSSSFTLEGLGFPTNITIMTNSATDFNGITIIPGISLRVRGIEGPNDTVLATSIKSGSGGGSPPAILQGVVDSIGGLSITVLGTPVDTSTITVFKDVKDKPISSTAFLGLVQKGTIVKFKSASAGPTITWDEAELEDD